MGTVPNCSAPSLSRWMPEFGRTSTGSTKHHVIVLASPACRAAGPHADDVSTKTEDWC